MPLPRWEDDMRPVTEMELDEAMDKLALSMRPWVSRDFVYVKHLEAALGNHGSVDMMRNLVDGSYVAVKRMPNKWVCVGPREFKQRYPLSPELPWVDMGILRKLRQRSYPYACDLHGIFCDSETTFTVTTLARCGDLFSWCLVTPGHVLDREELMRPIVAQLLAAVRWLHALGIAHRDLSPENILLTDDGTEKQVRLVDFGMATTSRWSVGEVRGKEPFQAPEMHEEKPYDSFLADAFQLGLVLFVMAARDKPWESTKPGRCARFRHFSTEGRLMSSHASALAGVSVPLLILMEGLLERDAQMRLTLGEACYEEERDCVWSAPWLRDAGEAMMLRWPWQGSMQCPIPGAAL